MEKGEIFKSADLRDLVMKMTGKDIKNKNAAQWFSRSAKFHRVPIRKTGGKIITNTSKKTRRNKNETETDGLQEADIQQEESIEL